MMTRFPLNSSATELLIRLKVFSSTREIQIESLYFLLRCCISLGHLLFHVGKYTLKSHFIILIVSYSDNFEENYF